MIITQIAQDFRIVDHQPELEPGEIPSALAKNIPKASHSMRRFFIIKGATFNKARDWGRGIIR